MTSKIFDWEIERIDYMKRLLIGILTAGTLLAPQFTFAAGMEVPKDIYQWVQSTARVGYYFNKQQMNYRVDENGIIDLNTLNVPTIRLYDDVQIQDVISKRRWNMLSMEGYDQLVGEADYLTFRLAEGTVQVTERVDLDDKWGTLDTDKSGTPIKLDSFSEKNVEGKFYRTILEYAAEHQEELIQRSKGKLSEEDQKRLEELKKPAGDASADQDKKDKKNKKDKKSKKKDKKDNQEQQDSKAQKDKQDAKDKK